MESYLEAVNPSQHATILLAGVKLRLERARLGLHLRLGRLAADFDEAEGAEERAKALRAYLRLAGVSLPINELSGREQLLVYVRLRLLNEWRWDLPFMRDRPPVADPPPYDYPDRIWAWWVHKLASRYGWTREQIFDLWPEEAACYLQEIFVSEFNEAEERRSLSEVAYRYDKGSKKSRYIPLPRPGWMVGGESPRVRRIRKGALPVGNVVKLDEIIH